MDGGGVWLGDLRILSELFADDVVLLTSSCSDLQLSLVPNTSKCEGTGMRISPSKSEAMVLSQIMGGVFIFSLEGSPTPVGGVQVSRGLIHVWGSNRAGD